MQPEAVKKAAADADAMIMELAQGRTPTLSVVQAPPEEAPSPAESTDQGVTVSHEQEPEPKSEPEPKPEPKPEHSIEAELRNELSVAEQRYRSLQGMFNKQAEQIETLHQLLAGMQSAPPPKAAPQEEAPLIGKEDEDAFGADLIDMARRVSKMEMAAQMKAMREELADLKSQVGGVQQDTRSTRYEQFLGHLADQVENTTGRTFDAINTDPAFEEWIKASPSRLALFKSSISEMDTEGALTFFDIYAKQLAPIPQVATPPAEPSIDPRLARQVAPGKSKSTPSPAAAQGGEKRLWTRSGIADFYTKMKSYPKETADALEREIASAQREGRVDYSK